MQPHKRGVFLLMRLKSFILLSALYLIASSFHGRLWGKEETFWDSRGKRITLEVPVKRAVVTMTYEVVCSLGAMDRVVGISQNAYEFSPVFKALLRKNPSLRRPIIGTPWQIDLEKLTQLNPDVVIMWANNPELLQFLENKGIKVMAFWPDGLKDLFELIEVHGRLFAKEERAKEIIMEMRRFLSYLENKKGNHKRVLILSDPPTRVIADQGIINDVLRCLNAENVACGLGVKYANVSLERIIGWNPDTIFLWRSTSYGPEWILKHPAWQKISAVQNQRVYRMPHLQTWSPSIIGLALWMDQYLHLERIESTTIQELMNAFFKKVFSISWQEVKTYEKD